MAGSNRFRYTTSRLAVLLLALALAGLFLPGCQPALTPSPMATPRVISVEASAALQSLQALFKTCTGEQENAALVYSQAVFDQESPSTSDITLRWSLNTQPPGFAAVLGYEQLVLVINPQNPLTQISQEQVTAIWSGALKKWPGDGSPGEIQPWAYPSSEDIQQIFEHIFLSDSPPAKNAVFTAPDPQAMIEAISSKPGAVGYLPRRWLNPQVKEIQVQGIAPSVLRQPILALTPSRPEGMIKNWLLCLQERLVE